MVNLMSKLVEGTVSIATTRCCSIKEGESFAHSRNDLSWRSRSNYWEVLLRLKQELEREDTPLGTHVFYGSKRDNDGGSTP